MERIVYTIEDEAGTVYDSHLDKADAVYAGECLAEFDSPGADGYSGHEFFLVPHTLN